MTQKFLYGVFLFLLVLPLVSTLDINSTYPLNNSVIGNGSTNFTANASGLTGIANATIYIYNSTGLYNQTTQSVLLAPLTATFGIVINMVNGVYTWFWTVTDILNAQATGSNSTVTINTGVSTCGTLSSANSVYALINNISASGTCFTITANNITLLGNGYIVTGNTTGDGISATGRANLTIRNMILNNFTRGIFFSATTNSLISNSKTTASNSGIRLETSANRNNISNNVISTINTPSSNGIIITLSSGNNIVNNNNISTSGSSLNNIGIFLQSSANNNTIINNRISTNGTSSNYGIDLSQTYNNNITGNIIYASGTTSSNIGIFFIQTENNTIAYNNISTNGTTSNGAFFFAASGILAKNDILINNNLGTIAGLDLSFGSANMNGTYLIDQPIRNYSFTGVGSIINIKSTNFGVTNFLVPINGSGRNLSYDVQIGNNSVFVNSSQTGLNKSANITLINLPIFLPAEIFRDGIVCNTTTSPSCYNFTSLSLGTVIFNVSSWSNYSIGFGGDIDPPIINILYPISTTIYGSQVTAMNYSVTDANLQACWYSLNLGMTNVTITCNNNITGISSIEGSNTWRVYANDSLGQENFSSITFTVDLSYLDLIFKPSNLVIVGTQSNVTGICIPELNCSLYINNTLVSNSDIQTLMLGNYFYNFNTTGNANYTAQDINGTLRVVRVFPCAENKYGFFNKFLPHIIRDGCT